MKKISKQGIYRGLSYEEYDSILALRSTYLKKHLHSPAKCQILDTKTTEALVFGVAAHVGVLEGMDELHKRYHFIDKFEGDKRTSEYKKLKASATNQAEITNKILLDAEDLEAIAGIRSNCFIHPTAKLLLAKVEPETVIVFKHKPTGLLCKIRLDIAPYEGMDVIPDLKTCEDASEDGFKHSINKYHYDFSAAMYCYGASLAFKKEINLALWIAAEKSAPFKVQVHEMGPSRFERASAKFHESLRIELECQKSGVWPAYLDGGVYVQD